MPQLRGHIKRAHPTRLVTGRDEASGRETVEVAHEALIQHWSRLREWLADDRDFLMWRQHLQVASGEWQRTGYDAGALLRAAPLAEAERWFSERKDDLTQQERAFIIGSVSARNRRRNLIGVAVVAVVMVSVAIWQYREAARLRLERSPILPEMVEIKPGRFMMGSPEEAPEAYPSEYPQHEVVIGKAFKMGKYEVTFGLHDMLGNVWEWTQDCWHDSYKGESRPDDGTVWEMGENCALRVIRGGSWGDDPGGVRSAGRGRNLPAMRFNFVGFRLAQDL